MQRYNAIVLPTSLPTSPIPLLYFKTPPPSSEGNATPTSITDWDSLL